MNQVVFDESNDTCHSWTNNQRIQGIFSISVVYSFINSKWNHVRYDAFESVDPVVLRFLTEDNRHDAVQHKVKSILD